MPGSIQNAVATLVMPLSLSMMFVHRRIYPLIDNEYKNGESQRSLEANTSRKYWELRKDLTPEDMLELRFFWEQRKGPLEAFYFYDPFETSPKFSYDETGVATTGRYTVRFDGSWPQVSGYTFAQVDIGMVQIA